MRYAFIQTSISVYIRSIVCVQLWMNRRGNCYDNAVAESFFQLLKRERVKKKICTSRTEARSDIFEYIEMFYNSKRRHGSNGQRSPLDYEKAHQKMVILEFWWLFRDSTVLSTESSPLILSSCSIGIPLVNRLGELRKWCIHLVSPPFRL